MTSLPVIHYDYLFSPYGQKTKLLLQLAGVPFQRVDVSVVLPRPELEALGITYRRIPVLTVGKDAFCDSNLIINVILGLNGYPGLAKTNLKLAVSDRAWESWGNETFASVLPLVPAELLSEGFVKDRVTVFPILAREDFKEMRKPAIAELRSRMSFLEDSVLTHKDGPFVGGKEMGVVDVHIIYGIRWALKDLGAEKEEGVGKADFPKVWALIDALPAFAGTDVSGEDATKTIVGAKEYEAVGSLAVEAGDPLGFKVGDAVKVESADTTPGAHPQAGKFLGSTRHEVILGLDNGVRLHFPREGYLVKKA